MKPSRHPPLPWKFTGGGRLSAIALLSVQWRSLPTEALSMYLKRLITRELQCRPRRIGLRIEPPWNANLQPRFRIRRREVALALRVRGVKISERAIAWSMPSWRRWPGRIYLIGERCDEDLRDDSRKIAS
jgi:hypothetical protein